MNNMMYQGVMPGRQTEPRMVQLSDIGMRAAQEAAGRAAQTIDLAEETFKHIVDYGTAKKADTQVREVTGWYDDEVKRRAGLEHGHPESLWNEDGTLKEDALNELRGQYEERLRDINPRFLDTRRGLQTQEQIDGVRANAIERNEGYAHGLKLKKAREVWEENWELAVKEGKTSKALGLLDEGVRNGVLSETKAKIKRLGLAKASMGRGVNVSGVEYGGLDAALAAQAVRDGYDAGRDEEDEVSGEAEQPDEDERLYMKLDRPGEVQVGMRDERGVNGAELWSETGDHAQVIRGMSDVELGGLSDAWTYNLAISSEERGDGVPRYVAAVTAPDSVQRAAAVADARGAMSADALRGMVARITMDAVTQDVDATPEAICKMFDESGIYEGLGDGDAEMGKVRTMQVVHEMVRRGKQGTAVLGGRDVERAVVAAVNEASFGEGSEWKLMEGLEPGVGEKEAYNKPTDAEGRKRWFALFEVYKKYRDRFNPQHPSGEPDKKEFAEKAQRFWKWYMGGSHVYKDAKAEEMAAAKDWYTAKVYEGLLGSVNVGKDGKAGYGSYASDVAVMREVLSKEPPRTLGAEERLRLLERKERDAEARSKKFRLRAQEDYKALLGMKQEHKENSEKAQKAREKAEADAKKAAEKEEKRLEAIELRKRNVMRRMPRSAEWGWDGKVAPDGAMPACTLPEDEYKRLVDVLGYDGTQDVYIQVAGARIQVVGTNKRGRVMLNSPAVAKVQKKPSAKKGEKWKLNGTLGFSYDFKNVSANN